VSEVIESKRESITRAVNSAESIEQADIEIEGVLSEQWKYFTCEYILDAVPSHIDSLFELASEIILGHNSIRQNSERARQAVKQEYEISDEQEEWIQMFVERAVIEKETISKPQLLEKPFSDYGGYDYAIDLFQEPDLDAVISTFNDQLLLMPETANTNTDDGHSTNETNYV
jgi:hypothetical protein